MSLVSITTEALNELIDQRVEQKLKEWAQKGTPSSIQAHVQEAIQPLPSETKVQSNQSVKIKNIYWRDNKKNSLVWKLEMLNGPENGKELSKNFNLKSVMAISHLLTELKKLGLPFESLTQAQDHNWDRLKEKRLEIDIQKKDNQNVIYFVRNLDPMG